MKIQNRQIDSCRDKVAAKSKYFVLYIGIVLIQDCQTTANDSDIFIDFNY